MIKIEELVEDSNKTIVNARDEIFEELGKKHL